MKRILLFLIAPLLFLLGLFLVAVERSARFFNSCAPVVRIAAFALCAFVLHDLGTGTVAASHVALATAPILMAGDTMRLRTIYQALADKYNYNKVGADGRVKPSSATSIALGTLRQDRLITNSAGGYNFNFVDTGNQRVTERMLNRNDRFAIAGIRLSIMKEAIAKVGTGIPMSYPDRGVFTGAANTGNPTDLDVFFNAQLSLLADQRQLIAPYSTMLHRYVPEAQGGEITAAATPIAASAGASPVSTYALPLAPIGNKQGYLDMEPLFEISGDGKNQFQLTAPSFGSIDVADTAGTNQNFVVLELLGFLISGPNVGVSIGY